MRWYIPILSEIAAERRWNRRLAEIHVEVVAICASIDQHVNTVLATLTSEQREAYIAECNRRGVEP